MAAFIKTDICRLVYGFLTDNCPMAAEVFLENCVSMKEYLTLKKRGRRVPVKVDNLTLEDYLDDLGTAHDKVDSVLDSYNCQDKVNVPARISDKIRVIIEKVILSQTACSSNSELKSISNTDIDDDNVDDVEESNEPNVTPEPHDDINVLHEPPKNNLDTPMASSTPHVTTRRNKRKQEKTDITNIKQMIPEVVLQPMIDNLDFHEKLASSINKVLPQVNEEIDLNSIIKSVVEQTSEDPLFDEYVQELCLSISPTKPMNASKDIRIEQEDRDLHTPEPSPGPSDNLLHFNPPSLLSKDLPLGFQPDINYGTSSEHPIGLEVQVHQELPTSNDQPNTSQELLNLPPSILSNQSEPNLVPFTHNLRQTERVQSNEFSSNLKSRANNDQEYSQIGVDSNDFEIISTINNNENNQLTKKSMNHLQKDHTPMETVIGGGTTNICMKTVQLPQQLLATVPCSSQPTSKVGTASTIFLPPSSLIINTGLPITNSEIITSPMDTSPRKLSFFQPSCNSQSEIKQVSVTSPRKIQPKVTQNLGHLTRRKISSMQRIIAPDRSNKRKRSDTTTNSSKIINSCKIVACTIGPVIEKPVSDNIATDLPLLGPGTPITDKNIFKPISPQSSTVSSDQEKNTNVQNKQDLPIIQSDKITESVKTSEKSPLAQRLEKRQSLSTPRRPKGYIRNLTFSTPPRCEMEPRKAHTSPRTNRKLEKFNVKSPLKSAKICKAAQMVRAGLFQSSINLEKTLEDIGVTPLEPSQKEHETEEVLIHDVPQETVQRQDKDKSKQWDADWRNLIAKQNKELGINTDTRSKKDSKKQQSKNDESQIKTNTPKKPAETENRIAETPLRTETSNLIMDTPARLELAIIRSLGTPVPMDTPAKDNSVNTSNDSVTASETNLSSEVTNDNLSYEKSMNLSNASGSDLRIDISCASAFEAEVNLSEESTNTPEKVNSQDFQISVQPEISEDILLSEKTPAKMYLSSVGDNSQWGYVSESLDLCIVSTPKFPITPDISHRMVAEDYRDIENMYHPSTSDNNETNKVIMAESKITYTQEKVIKQISHTDIVSSKENKIIKTDAKEKTKEIPIIREKPANHAPTRLADSPSKIKSKTSEVGKPDISQMCSPKRKFLKRTAEENTPNKEVKKLRSDTVPSTLSQAVTLIDKLQLNKQTSSPTAFETHREVRVTRKRIAHKPKIATKSPPKKKSPVKTAKQSVNRKINKVAKTDSKGRNTKITKETSPKQIVPSESVAEALNKDPLSLLSVKNSNVGISGKRVSEFREGRPPSSRQKSEDEESIHLALSSSDDDEDNNRLSILVSKQKEILAKLKGLDHIKSKDDDKLTEKSDATPISRKIVNNSSVQKDAVSTSKKSDQHSDRNKKETRERNKRKSKNSFKLKEADIPASSEKSAKESNIVDKNNPGNEMTQVETSVPTSQSVAVTPVKYDSANSVLQTLLSESPCQASPVNVVPFKQNVIISIKHDKKKNKEIQRKNILDLETTLPVKNTKKYRDVGTNRMVVLARNKAKCIFISRNSVLSLKELTNNVIEKYRLNN